MSNKSRRIGKELGRNERCWCGSGKKYKHCHLGRETQEPPTIQEVLHGLKTAYEQKYCLYPNVVIPDCSGNIIKAHTIQRNGGLSKIAVDGHVYTFMADFRDLKKNEGHLSPKRIGIGLASTFTGFCEKHDNQIFASLEKNSFNAGPEHSFLLGYRALCREIFVKKAVQDLASTQHILDKGRSKEEQYAMQHFFNTFQKGISASMRDLNLYKSQYDQILLTNDFSTIKYYILLIDQIPDYLCSGVLYPEYDFNGKLLQNLAIVENVSEHITFSVITTDIGGAIVFSWVGNSTVADLFILSLDRLSNTDKSNAITRFTFEFFENVYASPTWWNSLDEKVQKHLLGRLESAMDPRKPHSSTCLMNDGIQSVQWSIISRHTNIIV